jgi:hypothetical protein
MSESPAEPRKEPSEVKCIRCNATPTLTHNILNVATGGTLRMYKCECGEQMWAEFPQ